MAKKGQNLTRSWTKVHQTAHVLHKGDNVNTHAHFQTSRGLERRMRAKKTCFPHKCSSSALISLPYHLESWNLGSGTSGKSKIIICWNCLASPSQTGSSSRNNVETWPWNHMFTKVTWISPESFSSFDATMTNLWGFKFQKSQILTVRQGSQGGHGDTKPPQFSSKYSLV